MLSSSNLFFMFFCLIFFWFHSSGVGSFSRVCGIFEGGSCLFVDGVFALKSENTINEITRLVLSQKIPVIGIPIGKINMYVLAKSPIFAINSFKVNFYCQNYLYLYFISLKIFYLYILARTTFIDGIYSQNQFPSFFW